MSIASHTIEDVRREGGEYGQELAAALVLARTRGADRALQRQMARLVLLRIEAAVEKLKDTSSTELVEAYERSAKKGVHDELIRSGVVVPEAGRHAA